MNHLNQGFQTGYAKFKIHQIYCYVILFLAKWRLRGKPNFKFIIKGNATQLMLRMPKFLTIQIHGYVFQDSSWTRQIFNTNSTYQFKNCSSYFFSSKKYKCVSTNQRTLICSCDLWWKTNDTPASQAVFKAMSSTPFFEVQWCHNDKSELQSESSGGGFTLKQKVFSEMLMC